MNIDFQSVATLPGIGHKAFKEDAKYPGAVYESWLEVWGNAAIIFQWDIMTGDIKRVGIEIGNQLSVYFSELKTFADLKQLLSFIPLPYPENWP